MTTPRGDGVLESSRRHYPFGRVGRGALSEALSRTELDIMTMLGGGLANREIADNLGTTVGTTKWHIHQIFRKLRVRNRTEALIRGRELLTLASRGHELPPAGPTPEPIRRTELAILGLLNQGMTNQEIANNLAITIGTTKWHLNQIFGKLQARNRIEALARAQQGEWL